MQKVTHRNTVAVAFKRTAQVIAFGLGLLVFQSCGPHYVAQAPDAPMVVRPAPPYAGAIWIDGGWAWRGGRHVYTNGYYSRPRPGRVYVTGEWRQTPRGYYYNRGRWR